MIVWSRSSLRCASDVYQVPSVGTSDHGSNAKFLRVLPLRSGISVGGSDVLQCIKCRFKRQFTSLHRHQRNWACFIAVVMDDVFLFSSTRSPSCCLKIKKLAGITARMNPSTERFHCFVPSNMGLGQLRMSFFESSNFQDVDVESNSSEKRPNKKHVKNRFGKSTQKKTMRMEMAFCFENPHFGCSKRAGAQNIESQVEGVGSHVIGLPWVWAKTFASWIWKGEGCWAARRSTLSAAMIKCSFTAIPYLASMTTSVDSRTREGLDRATKSSTKGNDGRPEEVDTDSFDEEGSMRQLETHHHHSPNTIITPTSKTSTDTNIQTTTALKKKLG